MNRKSILKISVFTLLIGVFLTPVLIKAQGLDLLQDRTFDVSSGMDLEVKGASGDIDISGWDEGRVHVKVFGNDKAEEKIKFEFEETSSGIIVKAEKEDDSWFSWSNLRLKFEIKVPNNFNCQLKTAGGDIVLDNVEGELRLSTSGGDVESENSAGSLISKTSGGDISVRGHKGDGELKTSGGDIIVYSLEGNIEGSTSGGDIKLNVKNGKVYGSTSGGDVALKYHGENKGIELRTSGGDISLSLPGDLNADVYLKTSGGDFSVNFPSSKLNKKTKSSYEGEFNSGGPRIECKTTGGDIDISTN